MLDYAAVRRRWSGPLLGFFSACLAVVPATALADPTASGSSLVSQAVWSASLEVSADDRCEIPPGLSCDKTRDMGGGHRPDSLKPVASLPGSVATGRTSSNAATPEIPARGSRPSGETSFSVGYFSNLVWRGQELNTGASVQPMVDVSWKGFGFNYWSNYDVDKTYINETDYTLSYSGAQSKLGYQVGAIYYGLRNPTLELYLSLAYDVMLAPYATFYLDVDAGKGGFLMVGVGQPFAVTDALAVRLDAYVSANFENAAMGLDENGERFTDLYNSELKARIDFSFAGDWALAAQVAYSFALTDASRSGISGASATGRENSFWGGFGVVLAF